MEVVFFGPVILSISCTSEIEVKIFQERRKDSMFSEAPHCIGISWPCSNCSQGIAEPACPLGSSVSQQEERKQHGSDDWNCKSAEFLSRNYCRIYQCTPLCPGLSPHVPCFSSLAQSTRTSALILSCICIQRDISHPCYKGVEVCRWPFLGSCATQCLPALFDEKWHQNMKF